MGHPLPRARRDGPGLLALPDMVTAVHHGSRDKSSSVPQQGSGTRVPNHWGGGPRRWIGCKVTTLPCMPAAERGVLRLAHWAASHGTGPETLLLVPWLSRAITQSRGLGWSKSASQQTPRTAAVRFCFPFLVTVLQPLAMSLQLKKQQLGFNYSDAPRQDFLNNKRLL